jgi:hypothetical protein
MEPRHVVVVLVLLTWWIMDPWPPDAYVVDGIADGVARLERADGTLWEVPAARLPSGVREGDVLRATSGDEARTAFVVDPELTAARRGAARRAAERLRRGPEGDIDL